MQKFSLLFAALLCGFAGIASAQPKPLADTAGTTAKPHPILGTWRWTLPGKQCTETLQYRADGSRQGSSGEETTQASYAVPAVPSLLGFFKLSEITTQSNGKADCAGDLHEASDEAAIRYIQFSPKLDQVIICKSESLQACYGPLRRVVE